MRDDLDLDVVLSNPYNTKIIATSLKKTDKVDAFHLANLIRGGYIAECHVSEEKTLEYRPYNPLHINLLKNYKIGDS